MSLESRYSLLSLCLLLFLSLPALSQNGTETSVPTADETAAPTSAEVMRQRISRAKALIAVRNYPAAMYEMEGIRRESKDPTVLRVLNVLLMNAYLEQGDYKGAEDLLEDIAKAGTGDATGDYIAVAGQVVSSANSQAERYRSLGLTVNDRNLPAEASGDIESMRLLLETVIEKAKTFTGDENLGQVAVALVEGSGNARGKLARDAYDSKRWQNTVAEAREQLMGSRSKIISALDDPNADEAPETEPVSLVAVPEKQLEQDLPDEDEGSDPSADEAKTQESGVKPIVVEKKPEESVQARTEEERVNRPDPRSLGFTDSFIATDRPIRIIRSADKSAAEDEEASDVRQPNVKSSLSVDERVADSRTDDESAGSSAPIPVGSLIGYAVRRVNPIYPRQAKNLRLTGVVTVAVTIDEEGKVEEVNNADGPALLRRAASDAVRRWEFRPFTKDGQPVKAAGFVSFNFDL